ncbi:hypothetical protein KCMC57_65090 (plasmid) [Kitasatospora sp. CMC57]|uniref:Uncharacterized protein n=1 Tax=Kitasatospora sp. CMC57 TaxID=3231513 RepID=A0AB33K8C0_9ACTN
MATKTITWTGPSLEGVPDGYFAVTDPDQSEVVTFWRVGLPKGLKAGDVADRVYVRAFQGWLAEYRAPWVARVYAVLLADPEGTGRTFATCAVRCRGCGKALTDPVSKSVGYGPECRRGHNLEELGATIVGGFRRDVGATGPDRPGS